MPLKEADMFQTPESIGDGINQILRAGAQEAVGGFIMGVPGAMVKRSSFKRLYKVRRWCL